MNLLNLLALANLTAFACWGLHTAFQPGYIFGRVHAFLLRHTFPFVLAPLIGCPVCMASVWGTVAYWYGYGAGWFGTSTVADVLALWLAFVCATAGTATFVLLVKEGMHDIQDRIRRADTVFVDELWHTIQRLNAKGLKVGIQTIGKPGVGWLVTIAQMNADTGNFRPHSFTVDEHDSEPLHDRIHAEALLHFRDIVHPN